MRNFLNVTCFADRLKSGRFRADTYPFWSPVWVRDKVWWCLRFIRWGWWFWDWAVFRGDTSFSSGQGDPRSGGGGRFIWGFFDCPWADSWRPVQLPWSSGSGSQGETGTRCRDSCTWAGAVRPAFGTWVCRPCSGRPVGVLFQRCCFGTAVLTPNCSWWSTCCSVRVSACLVHWRGARCPFPASCSCSFQTRGRSSRSAPWFAGTPPSSPTSWFQSRSCFWPTPRHCYWPTPSWVAHSTTHSANWCPAAVCRWCPPWLRAACSRLRFLLVLSVFPLPALLI